MFGSYGFSLQGRSHQKGDVECQDSHGLRQLPEGWLLAVVADGVGSAPCSATGSRLAVDSLLDFCEKEMATQGATTDLLRAGYRFALEQLQDLAMQENIPLRDYDTTLTAALYNGAQVVVGQSGDGGVLAMDAQGHYTQLTAVQKGDSYSQVYPLRAGEDCWVFEQLPTDYVGLLLMTDGLLDVACPPLLCDQPQPLYCALIHRFFNSRHQTLTPQEAQACGQELMAWVQSEACAAITDDATALAVWSVHNFGVQPDEDYLKEPDWKALRQSRFDRLYPHLQPEGDE